jgi:putative flavoprotein involved in K+ transport
MADYLERYAEQFHLPVRNGVKVDSLSRNDEGYQISVGEFGFSAKNVIVATGHIDFRAYPPLQMN